MLKFNLTILFSFICLTEAQTTSRSSTQTTTKLTITSRITTPTITTTVLNPSISTMSSSNVKDINPNLNVIYWEKCGLNGRTKITKIFQSSSGSSNQHQLSYNPLTNSFNYRLVQSNSTIANELNIPLTFKIDGLIILFSFTQIDTISIYFGCPNYSNGFSSLYINAPGINQISRLDLISQDALLFSSFKDALTTFGCNSKQTIQSGSILYFPYIQSSLDILPIFQFYFNESKFSLNLNTKNGNIYLNTTDNSINIQLTSKPILNNEVYFYFTEESLQIYDSCDSIGRNRSTSLYSISLFNFDKLIIETSLKYKLGNGVISSLLNTFCSVQIKIDNIDDSIRLYQTYLPSNDILNQIEQFRSFLTSGLNNNLGIEELIQNEPKILFLSRDNNVDKQFFYRGIQDYINGFSDGQFNFWLGLDLLNKATNSNNYKLRIEAETKYGNIYEEYSYFKVGNKSNNFKIEINDITVKEGYSFDSIDGFTFSTFDFGDSRYLASIYFAGFWFSASSSGNQSNITCLTCLINDNNGTIFVQMAGYEKIEANLLKMYLIVRNYIFYI